MTEIIVRFQVEGWHCWPGAPDHRAYLRTPHRHMFHVDVSMPVGHDDREVEFHDLLDFCRAAMPPGDYGHRSCEMLARELYQKITRRYTRRAVVSVFEDGEVGARYPSYVSSQVSPE